MLKALKPAMVAALIGIAAPALAADATPAPAPAPAASAAPAAPAAPSAAMVALAATILTDAGIKASFDPVVPGMLSELETGVVRAHPEAKAAIHDVALALAREFGKTEQTVLDAASASLASHMAEPDLKATAAYFESAAGKAYVAAQPALGQDVGIAARAWRDKLSQDILARAKEEMKKKGIDF